MYSFSKSSNDCSLALFCGGGGVSAGFGGGGGGVVSAGFGSSLERSFNFFSKSAIFDLIAFFLLLAGFYFAFRVTFLAFLLDVFLLVVFLLDVFLVVFLLAVFLAVFLLVVFLVVFLLAVFLVYRDLLTAIWIQ